MNKKQEETFAILDYLISSSTLAMTSNNSLWNDTNSLTTDDISSLFLDFLSSNDHHNQHPMMYDDVIDEEFFSSLGMDHEQSQTPLSSTHTSSTQTPQPDLVCRVCSAPAYGYNFDQITCESCKAFFRRNALRHLPSLKCRYNGSCVIDIHTRRQCAYCRLKKCFDVNMRKDWIRTNEEKELRQLQKQAKEQKKLNKLTNTPEQLLSSPTAARKKKGHC